MKAGSLRPDDDLGALRESASSPSSGEVCLEVCSEHCFSLPSSVFYHICTELCTLRFVLCVGPVAQWNQSATLRRSRSRVQIASGPPDYVGCSSTGRALHCDCSGCEFKSRQPTQTERQVQSSKQQHSELWPRGEAPGCQPGR